MHFTVGYEELYGFADGKLVGIKPHGIGSRLWGDNYLDFQASDGKWWIPTSRGVIRYPAVDDFRKLAATAPERTFTKADGLFGDATFVLYEASNGDVWITSPSGENSTVRWEKATDTIHRYTTEDGLPANSGGSSFAEDRSGNIWIGFFFGQLVRFKDGKFRSFTEEGLLPQGRVARIFPDSRGRIWLATTSRGLFRIDDPNADTPTFQNISSREGLSSSQAICIAEDKFGRFWVGTGRGIDRIDETTGRIRTFSKADGLPFNSISYCYADSKGTLWFASNNSLVEWTPKANEESTPPEVLIDAISVNGNARNISEIGEAKISNLELASDERQVGISFLAISLVSGESLRYRYRLDEQPWSEPSAQRTVAFDLAPGTYDFAVKAINSDGIESVVPATVGFKILPPFWQSWWFVGLLLLFAGGAVFALDRYRVGKTKQVETALQNSRESEDRFRTLADTASDAIITIDEESKIVFVNEAIEKVFGYRPEELIGKHMPMLMPKKMRGGHHAGLGRYISTGNRNINWTAVPLPGLHKDGYEIPLEVSFGEFERDGKRYFTGIARDVSERHRAEQALQQAREERLSELQRVRTRIASDLHDDIGSSLTQIAVLSEVARGQAGLSGNVDQNTPLDRIKNVSRELVAVMSDIVWAINPQKDYLHDLILRMRRFGSDLFTERGIAFDLIAPDIDDDLQLGANIRRESFAIFKEAANNAAKYSECKAVHAEFMIENGWLVLKFEDDGKGFDETAVLSTEYRPEMGGNGLVSIQKRAADLGGRCAIKSAPGTGTSIVLQVPIHQNSVLPKH
ncbi:MAG: PAS domain S-box protein [Pyrinomonadaceae bacterium]